MPSEAARYGDFLDAVPGRYRRHTNAGADFKTAEEENLIFWWAVGDSNSGPAD